MSEDEFSEKAVIVTAGAQGMGRSIAEQFLQQGARVLIFDLDAELAVQTAQQLSQHGGLAVGVGGDVSQRPDVCRAKELCAERFGRLDMMIAQAGIADAQPLLEIEDASWQRILAVNLTGVFLCTQEADRAMARTGGGTIVVMASRWKRIFPIIILLREAWWPLFAQRPSTPLWHSRQCGRPGRRLNTPVGVDYCRS